MKTASFASLITGNIVYRCLNILINFLITLLLTRLLTTEGYGILSLLIANAAILNLISCLGADSAISFHLSKRDMAPGRIISILYYIVAFQFLSLLLVELVSYTVSGHFLLLKGQQFSLLIWGLTYFLCIILIDKYIAWLNGAHLYTLANKTLFFSNLIGLLILSASFFYRKGEPVVFYLKLFIAITAVQVIALFLVMRFSGNLSPRAEKIERKDWKSFFSYSFIAFFTNVIQFLAYRVDYWIVDFYHGKDELGLYSLAVKLGQMLWTLPLLFASIILPIAADRDQVEKEQKIFSLMRICNSFLLIAVLLLALTANWFIPFFAGTAYEMSVGPFICLLPGLLLFCVNINLAAYFAGKGMLRVNLIASSICFVLVLVLDFVLIPGGGIVGAAIASSIAYAVTSLYSIAQFMIIKRLPLSAIAWVNKQDIRQILLYVKKINGK